MNQRGCSLIEVLVATTLLAVGIASLAQLFTVAVASNISSTHRTRAAMLSAQKVEELRSMPWGTELQNGATDTVGAYTRWWSVSPVPSSPEMAAVVVVRVAWNQTEVGRLVTVKVRTQ
jgi:prepilin-type N-terminal cleavage/methylation domain-containing protein